MRLRSYLLLLVLVSTLPALLFSALLIYRSADERRAQLRSDIEDATVILAREVEAETNETIAALEVLAVSGVLASNDLGGFYQLAARVLARHPKWANLVLVGPRGEHLVNLNRPFGEPLPPLTNPAVFLEAARTVQAQVSNATFGVTVQKLLTVAAVPVLRDGVVMYVLGVAQQAENWAAILREGIPQGMQATILDRDYVVVSRTTGNERYAGRRAEAVFLEALARSPEAGEVEGITLEDQGGWGAYRRLPTSGWTLSVFMPLEDVEGSVRRLLTELAAGFLLLLLIGLVLAWLLARRISDAIERLTASVRAVGSGGYPLAAGTHIREVREAGRALDDASALLAERLAREQAARTSLEAADRAKDEYVAMLAHELRNPLAPINAALFLLQAEAPQSEASRRARTVIARQTQHLARLVDDLLDVTRIASGKVTLQREAVSLNELLRQVAEDHAGLAQKAGVTLTLELPKEIVKVDGDPTRLTQIVGNLLQNAVRFTPAGGRILLCLERMGAEAHIHVRDTGDGIDPAFLDRLFEPFFQGVHVSARARGGLGLGLPIVKGLAELHGGRVQAFSAGAGLGAQFVVTLPVLECAGQA